MRMEYTKEEQKTLDRLLSERNVLQNRVNSIQKEINKIKDTEKKEDYTINKKKKLISEIMYQNNILITMELMIQLTKFHFLVHFWMFILSLILEAKHLKSLK